MASCVCKMVLPGGQRALWVIEMNEMRLPDDSPHLSCTAQSAISTREAATLFKGHMRLRPLFKESAEGTVSAIRLRETGSNEGR